MWSYDLSFPKVPCFYTLQIFKDGDEASPSDYNGPREAAGIVSYVKKQSGPALVALKTEDEVKNFKALDAEKDSAGMTLPAPAC